MAFYTATVTTPWPAEKAFDFLADLRNFERWDPSVSSARLVEGDGPGLGTAYEVKVGLSRLRYVTEVYDRPVRTVVEARTPLLRSHDVIEVMAVGDGSQVRYDATLELNGPLSVADALLGRFFDRLGDRAAAGMAEALDGELIPA